jgi:hypothetical protein
MKYILFFSLMFALVSCTPSESAIQTAIVETQMWSLPYTTVVPYETPIPYSVLELDDLMVPSTGLPAGFTGAQISNLEEQSNLPPADYYIQQELSYDNKNNGKIQVWVYEDIENTLSRFEYEINLLNLECAKTESMCDPKDVIAVSNIGQAAHIISVVNNLGPKIHFLVFRLCNGVVKVYFGPFSDDTKEIITFAKRLNLRLTPVLCR